MIVYVATCPSHRMVSGSPLLCRHGSMTGVNRPPLGRAYLSEPRTFLSWEHACAVVLGWPAKRIPQDSRGTHE